MTYTDAARLAAYEKTGLAPEEIQEVVDMFQRELGASGAEIPAETKSWMERATFHVRKCAELEKENERLKKFKAYWDDVANDGFEISNWHLNGDVEPLYNLYVAALAEMDGESRGDDSMEITIHNFMINQIGNDLAGLMKLANSEPHDDGSYGSAILHVLTTLQTLKIPVKVHAARDEIYPGEPERDKKGPYIGVEIAGKMFTVA